MTIDATGVAWYAWLDSNDYIQLNRLASEAPTAETAITVDTSGDYDSVAGAQFTGGIIRVFARNSTDGKPYCFTSTNFGATWSAAVDVS